MITSALEEQALAEGGEDGLSVCGSSYKEPSFQYSESGQRLGSGRVASSGVFNLATRVGERAPFRAHPESRRFPTMASEH
ncbi:hypothetical protein SRHO_G00082170 [Serrasalmus rhombeus]